jgi:hypothetical protein
MEAVKTLISYQNAAASGRVAEIIRGTRQAF